MHFSFVVSLLFGKQWLHSSGQSEGRAAAWACGAHSNPLHRIISHLGNCMSSGKTFVTSNKKRGYIKERKRMVFGSTV